MVQTTASTPAPITASRLEIGGTWVQKVDFPVFKATAGELESEREPAPERPVVVKAAGKSAQPHPVLSPPRPVRNEAATRTARRKSGVTQRIPVLHPPPENEAGAVPTPGGPADPPPSPVTVSSIREAKTDPKRLAQIENCFTRLLPPEIPAGPPSSSVSS